MDLKSMATELFLSQLGGKHDNNAVGNALSQLIGSGSDLDLAGLVAQLQGGDLASAAKSWLGDGANDSVSPEQITRGLGAQQVENFATRLGLPPEDAAKGLAGMIPDLINQNSQGGSLLGTLGGLASTLLR